MSRRLLLGTALVSLVFGGGCVDQDAAFRRAGGNAAPQEVGGSIIAHDSAGQRFVVLSAAGEGVKPTFVPWAHKAERTSLAGDGKRLLVMDQADRVLGAIDPAAGKAETWALPSEFTTLTPGPDGQFAVMWHADGGALATSLVNPSEVGLIDLTKPAADKDNPRVATITGLSRPPKRVQISPTIAAGDGSHRVVWVESVSMIGLADFGPGGVRTLVVPLTPPESEVGILPTKTVVSVQGATLHLYLIASNSNDVVHLSVAVGGDKLSTSIDQLASGKVPTDLILFGEGDKQRIATLNQASKEIAVLDPSTGAGTYVTLAHSANRFVTFKDEQQAPWALLWAEGGASPWLQLVALDRVEKKKGKAVDVLKAELAVREVIRLDGYFGLRHNSTVTGVSLLQPSTTKLTSFAGTGLVRGLRMRGDSLFIHGQFGATSRVSRIELSDLHGSSVAMSPGGDKMLEFGDAGVAITGQGLGGFRAAIFVSGDLTTKPIWLEGLFLTGLLDRKEDN
ncbi:MAG: hypothetical protein KC502_19620 [Myxococcales bacterium]|nr:hypothetical protein [Myxococcales bacterium]